MTGSLDIVGLGPGGPAHRTRAAEDAIRAADVLVGYRSYLDQCADLASARQTQVPGAMGAEQERAEDAVSAAVEGYRVALVSSGDAGIYGMASVTLSVVAGLAGDKPAVRVLPGVTAAVAAGALLGAPLARDFACLTLSDHLAPWEAVEARVRALAGTDLALALYNPRSRSRPWQLDRVRDLLCEHRAASVPVGLVTDAARDGERVTLTTLAGLDTSVVGMRSTVLVGSSATERLGDWLVTAREVGP